MKASDVLGLEITEDSIVLDVKSQQKMERKTSLSQQNMSSTEKGLPNGFSMYKEHKTYSFQF